MPTTDNGSVPLPPPGLFITGLGSQYPPYLLVPEKLACFAERFYDVQRPGLRKLLQINASTGIETRASIQTFETGFACESIPPSIADLDQLFRQDGVDLTVQACGKAIVESQVTAKQITHTIAVTCMNQGNPGYDLLVNRKLSLSEVTDRTLLHGVGCAGGLSIMRAAAQIACGATLRGRPACILAYACELSGALFSDAAAAFVLCNKLALKEIEAAPLFELIEWDSALIPNTIQHLACYTDPHGFRSVLTREVPKYVIGAVGPMFDTLLPLYERQVLPAGGHLGVADFDWAVHPGGKILIEGVEGTMKLDENQLRASREIYKTRGNSSSPTVLSVLDKLRTYRRERDHVVATSFGPGLVIEMALLKRCDVADKKSQDAC
ncbi:uncharacterized protein GIQ15_04987 [Arthroderma uncinatum]|uniref:uncharacterized protein n=1 Tax=Arthroderma uncinatum TaxID=74035 RepID=UPI00144A72A5|nr:uncharacterized protein GIQ15_04987 [Arthroderma uncinatum]KAF3482228.1 hypothetical protein GIQ15_04987 [Arthroderma uncinatum]